MTERENRELNNRTRLTTSHGDLIEVAATEPLHGLPIEELALVKRLIETSLRLGEPCWTSPDGTSIRSFTNKP